jgi:hypothetical protein
VNIRLSVGIADHDPPERTGYSGFASDSFDTADLSRHYFMIYPDQNAGASLTFGVRRCRSSDQWLAASRVG